MLTYTAIALIAFVGGFFAAALLGAGRRSDAARADAALADAVDAFTDDNRRSPADGGDAVSVSRSDIEGLRRALRFHDELGSA